MARSTRATLGATAICGMLAGPFRRPAPRSGHRVMSLSRYFDRVAIALSAICIVHCLAIPLLAALLPIALVGFGSDNHFHEWMLWGVVPTSLIGFGLGLRYHGHFAVALAGAAGLGIVALAALVAHGNWQWWQEVVLSMAGSIVLVLAHWRNFVEVRRCHRHE